MVNVSSTLDERTLDLHKVFDDYIYLYCKFMTIYKLCDSLVVKNISHAEYSNMSRITINSAFLHNRINVVESFF